MAREMWLPKSDVFVELGPDNVKLEFVAQQIAIRRARAVAEVMCHLAAIRSLQTGANGSSASVRCVAAAVQDTGAKNGQQAAHLLPGMIRINNFDCWDLADPSSFPNHQSQVSRLQLSTKMSFAKTVVLNAAFNRADSQAEMMAGGRGLKQLFGEVVGSFWSSARTDPARPLAIDAEAVFAALGVWYQRVNGLYAEAAERKTNAWIAADGAGSSSAEDRELEGRVLEQYAFSQGIQSAIGFVYHQAQAVFMRYERI